MSDDRLRYDPASDRLSESDSARERWLDRLLDLFTLRSRDSVREDLESALSDTTEDTGFSPQERAMLRNVLGFHRIRTGDVMVPRADIVAVPADTTLAELLDVFRKAGHSRLPVYGETLDEPLGMVHIRDFLALIAARAEAASSRRSGQRPDGVPDLGGVDLSQTLPSAEILRPVLFVPESMPAVDLLARMQATRTHIALIIDEYGGTEGLVSIENLIETVVGDIEDEHDPAAARRITPSENGAFLADARASLEEVSEALGSDLSTEPAASGIETLGGLVLTLAGRVPSIGESIPGPNLLQFEVLEADPHRVKRLLIRRRAGSEAAGGQPPDTVEAVAAS